MLFRRLAWTPFALLLFIITGCGHHQAVAPAVASDLPDGDRAILAGEWEYEDGAVVTLRLDDRGNGTYAWKDGRLETTRFGDRTWVGKWYQRENDREGGFVIKLSPDYNEGEGTWWYLRIGDDRAPAQKGGSFRLTRKTSLTNLNDTPAVP
ncbi:hypothetical protein [Nitrospira moscoviensis]|uniref:Lipoprotein n=1 Tax=Nitrospira moscoviensis TaxID=42253 RepID=A0A0K2GJR0_NITMO|nr:hypothetical protein [Nitrospira moscoviensis]ALA61190.1 conserved exported protein of unknown function [Nitrospira moscoviensis]